MSDLRIALVAEGPTDRVVIEAALRSIIPRSFVLTQLQPDTSSNIGGGFGPTGTGWAGVYSWCRQMAGVGVEPLEDNPILSVYDLIIIHLDGGVAEETYGAGNIGDNPRDDLPCFDWPPESPDIVTDGLRAVLLGWLGQIDSGCKTIFCIPSYCTETWVAAALYGEVFEGYAATDIELFKDVYRFLLSRPKPDRILTRKAGRVKKRKRLYQSRQDEIGRNWDRCSTLCSQAGLFGEHVLEVSQA